MMKQYVFAGFGGQGMLLIGKFLAMANMLDGKHVSWLPSYGPEMRGGTANCNVILSDTPVGSPIVQHPNVLIVMNTPSLDNYEPMVVPGGKIFVDSTLITRTVERDDVEAFYIPATQMATDMGYHGLANMILLGAVLAKTGCVDDGTVDEALHHVIPARKANLFDANKACIEAGKAYVC